MRFPSKPKLVTKVFPWNPLKKKKGILSHITKNCTFSLNSLNLPNYQDCILKLLILLTYGQVSLLQQRLIITCYTVHVKMLKAL